MGRARQGVGRFGLGLAAALGAAVAIAGPASGEGAAARRPLTVEALEPLSFGRLTVGSGRGGTVTIDPRSGRKILGGGAVDLGGGHHPARFLVRGEPNARFLVTLPRRVEVVGGRNAGSRAVVEDFVPAPTTSGVLGFDGAAIVAVGATLRLDRELRTADWNADFTVFVDYVH